jgi:hypothetical protein
MRCVKKPLLKGIKEAHSASAAVPDIAEVLEF